MLRDRLERHRAHMESLDRDARRVPWLLGVAVLAIPIGYFWGLAAAVVAVVAAVFLVGSAYYLIWGHRGEYLQKIAELQQELRRL